jgi:hypothetical protein
MMEKSTANTSTPAFAMTYSHEPTENRRHAETKCLILPVLLHVY